MPLFGRRKKDEEERALAEFDAARREALERLRSRWRQGDPAAGPPPPPQRQPADAGGQPPHQAEAAAAGAPAAPADAAETAEEPFDAPVAATAPDFLLKDDAGGPQEEAQEAGFGDGVEQPASGGEEGGDLLDLFREAKNETAQGGLASEVEEVSIDELLSDLARITAELGMKPRPAPARAAVAPAPELTPDDTPVRVEKVEPHAVPRAADEDDGLADIMPIADPEDEEIVSLLEDEPEPPAPQVFNAPVRRAPATPPPERKGGPGGTLMHVLIVGLTLALASGAGLQAARGHSALVSGGERATPAVLGERSDPFPLVRVTGESGTPTPRPTKKPTPSPSPSPTPTLSPSPTPSPTPVKTPRVRRDPAFFTYRVEYGDSLTSIAMQDGLCPDHILWNNPGRTEETPLRVNDRLILPRQPGVIHTVREGDTLQSIAILYNATVNDITGVQGNEVATDADLVPGDRLLVARGIPQSAFDLDDEAWQMMRIPSRYGYVWPFYGQVTTYYGEERPGYVHNAIDIGGLGHYGLTVVAAAAGTVVFVGYDANYGDNVIIEHPDGSRTRYAHFSRVYVRQGQYVDRSQPVGALGCSGASTGTHLHFELWRDGAAVDPLEYLP